MAARPDPMRLPHPIRAALASMLLPGVGQWYTGHRRRALLLGAITMVIVVPVAVVAAVVAFGDGRRVLGVLADPFFDRPGLIVVLLAAQAAVALFQLWAGWDAWRLAIAAGGGPPRGAAAAVSVAAGVLMAAMLAVPHVWVAERGVALYDLLTFDFSTHRDASGESAPTVPPTTAAAAITTSTAPTAGQPSTTAPPTGSTAPVETTTTSPAPVSSTTTIGESAITTSSTTTVAPGPIVDDWQTVVLLGGDSGPGRWGVRTDTIVVAAISPSTGRAALFSVPRNWARVLLPEGHPAADPDCGCYTDILNALYQWGLLHPEAFPGAANPGAESLLPALENLLGIPIDHYALIDLVGFEQAVDLLGGVDINVRVTVTDPGHVHPDGTTSDIVFWPGLQHMDGRDALAYARARQQTDDYQRMDRQRCVLEAVAEQADPGRVLRALPAMVEVLTGSLVTDIPVGEWPEWVDTIAAVETGATVSVRLVPGAPELAGTGDTYIQNYDLVRDTVRAALELPLDEALATIGVPSLDRVCG